jgi:phage recombination protein Bet
MQARPGDIDAWLEAAPPPEATRPKRLGRKKQKMTNAIELSEHRPTAVVVHRDVSAPLEFTPQQQAMIRDTYANGASQKEFEVLMEVAKVRRLNPLLRQVHFVKRRDYQKDKDIWSVQVSVDGLRAIAERTGKYDGQDEAEYERNNEGLIIACRVRVYRKDWSRPAIGVAYWSEYVQTKKDGSPTKFWADMPHVMIAKCAEAIAMRKAFPEDMGGLYVDEEMQQADNAPQLLQVNPHVGPGQDANASPGDGGALGEHIASKLQKVKDALPRCDSYDKALALRAIIGSRTQQSELMRKRQDGAASGDISPAQEREIDKLWQHCDRQVAKLEKQLATGPEDSIAGDDDGTEALGAPERDRVPGEDDD